jgi:hypothetical protein
LVGCPASFLNGSEIGLKLFSKKINGPAYIKKSKTVI